MNKKLLLINDMAGYGKVALSAMIPVLSHLKYEIFNLPTALVSNTLDYGSFDILETTGYMKNTLEVWDKLGFSFDAVSTGFIVSEEQTELITDFCTKQSKKGTLIFTDPIMGDDGHLYNGVTEDTVRLMRRLIGAADYIVPNYTEAVCLAGAEYRAEGLTIEQYHGIIDALRSLGASSVVITSAVVLGSDKKAVVGYDSKCGSYFDISFDEIPVRFPGTGDIFSAVMIGRILDGGSLREAVRSAMDSVYRMIDANKDNADKYKGIPLEMCLGLLDTDAM